MTTPTHYTARVAIGTLALSLLFSASLLISAPLAFGDGGGGDGGGGGGGMNASGTNDPSGVCGNVGSAETNGGVDTPIFPGPTDPPVGTPLTPTGTPTTPTPTTSTPTPTTPTTLTNPTGESTGVVGGGGSCGLTYYCSGKSLYRQEVSCANTFVQACAYQCVSGSCVSAPDPSLSITADPRLLRSGNSTVVSWTAQNVTSCVVRGTNGDMWSGVTDAAGNVSGSEQSSPITSRTTYTLECLSLEGESRTEQVVVQVIPTWREL